MLHHQEEIFALAFGVQQGGAPRARRPLHEGRFVLQSHQTTRRQAPDCDRLDDAGLAGLAIGAEVGSRPRGVAEQPLEAVAARHDAPDQVPTARRGGGILLRILRRNLENDRLHFKGLKSTATCWSQLGCCRLRRPGWGKGEQPGSGGGAERDRRRRAPETRSKNIAPPRPSKPPTPPPAPRGALSPVPILRVDPVVRPQGLSGWARSSSRELAANRASAANNVNLGVYNHDAVT
jgi:hypothetical protein